MQIEVQLGKAMPEEKFQTWARTFLRMVLNANGIEARTDHELGAGLLTWIAMNTIYIDRGGDRFEKYAGTRETLAMVAWPAVFPERFKASQPVTVAPAIRFLHVNEATGLSLLSMDKPDLAKWAALEQHIAREPIT